MDSTYQHTRGNTSRHFLLYSIHSFIHTGNLVESEFTGVNLSPVPSSVIFFLPRNFTPHHPHQLQVTNAHLSIKSKEKKEQTKAAYAYFVERKKLV